MGLHPARVEGWRLAPSPSQTALQLYVYVCIASVRCAPIQHGAYGTVRLCCRACHLSTLGEGDPSAKLYWQLKHRGMIRVFERNRPGIGRRRPLEPRERTRRSHAQSISIERRRIHPSTSEIGSRNLGRALRIRKLHILHLPGIPRKRRLSSTWH